MEEPETFEQEDLKEEAAYIREIRRSSFRETRIPRNLPGWKKAVYLVFILLTVTGSSYLLIFEKPRTGFIQAASAALGLDLTPSDEQVFELPPPPPKAAERQVIVQSGGPVFSSDDEFEGILYATPGSNPALRSGAETAKEQPQFTAPPRSEGSERAFRLLSTQSEVIRRLIEGRSTDLEFKSWNPVQNKPPVFFIDVLALRTSSREEVHLVWEVNIESERIRPLSQAARDLVR